MSEPQASPPEGPLTSKPQPGLASPSTGGPQPSRRDPVALLITWGIPGFFAIVGALLLVIWLRGAPNPEDVAPRTPTSDRSAGATGVVARPAGEPGGAVTPGAMPGSPSAPGALVGGPVGGASASAGSTAPTAATSSGAPVASVPGFWPNFRGPNRNNISPDSTSLLTSWGGGPTRLWSVSLGEGYAGAAVADSRVYVLDYDQTARADKLRCLSLANGQELWSQSYPVDVKRNHGMSRTVPALYQQYVVTLGPKCHVMCCDAKTGAVKWRMDLVAQYGATVPPWYAGQCPLIDNGKVILAPGGKALMIAVDIASGKVVWQAPNPRGWKMTHTSIVPVSVAGKKMYVYCGSGGVAGVAADKGTILWDTTAWVVSTATVPTPVPIGDGRIFLCGGYNSGAMMLRLVSSGGKFTAEQVFRLKPTVFGSDQQTPILYKGYLYGVIPGGQLACLSLEGKQVWASGTDRFGLGPYMIAGGNLYVLDDKGELSLVSASPNGYKRLARAKVLNGPDAWGPMALAGGRLIVRDLTTMACLQVGR